MTDVQPTLPGVLSDPGRRAVRALQAGADLPTVRHRVNVDDGGRRTPSGKFACEVCGEAWPCSTQLRRVHAPVITAVDLSYTSTGIAWLDRDGFVGVTSVQTRRVIDPYRHGTPMAPRRAAILRHIIARCGPQTLVVREDRLSTLKVAGNAALDLAALHATVEDWCDAAGLALASVNVGRVKIYGANTGAADKAMMVDAARREFAGLLTVSNDDEADALWTLAVAAHVHGLPMVRVRKRRVEVVEQCRAGWPVVTPVMPAGLRTRLRSTH